MSLSSNHSDFVYIIHTYVGLFILMKLLHFMIKNIRSLKFIDFHRFVTKQRLVYYFLHIYDLCTNFQPTWDSISAACVSKKYFAVGRISGTLQFYSLPGVTYITKFVINCRPQKMFFNCDSRYVCKCMSTYICT